MINLIACSFPEDYSGKILEVRHSVSHYFHLLVAVLALYQFVLLFRKHTYWWHSLAAILLVYLPVPFYSPCTADLYFVITSMSAFVSSFLLIYAWTNMAKESRRLAEQPEHFNL